MWMLRVLGIVTRRPRPAGSLRHRLCGPSLPRSYPLCIRSPSPLPSTCLFLSSSVVLTVYHIPPSPPFFILLTVIVRARSNLLDHSPVVFGSSVLQHVISLRANCTSGPPTQYQQTARSLCIASIRLTLILSNLPVVKTRLPLDEAGWPSLSIKPRLIQIYLTPQSLRCPCMSYRLV